MDQKIDNCVTNLIDDVPSSEDRFGRTENEKPHQRVADAICDMIGSAEKGGKAIGLEGGWGSGKSTVVRILTDKFSGNPNNLVVLFDAWAHEGDPLRRSFIESIAGNLIEKKWVDKITWEEKLEELARRRKTTETKIAPKPTELGKEVAVSVLLVPLGSAILAAALRDTSLGVGLGYAIHWPFWIGCLLLLSPFVVLLFHWFYVSFRIHSRVLYLVPLLICVIADGLTLGRLSLALGSISIWVMVGVFSSLLLGYLVVRSKGAQASNARDPNWSFLLSQSSSETKTESVETADPTSNEFDKYFLKLMQESLEDNNQKKLLIVLDNLDRVDADTAKNIWATLQTFLQDRDHVRLPWFRRLWLLVPYDKNRIVKIWSNGDSKGQRAVEEPQGVEKEWFHEDLVAHSFLDKSFQIRFVVSPPVLSDWKSYLCQLVVEALPSHGKEAHMIYRVFEHVRRKGGSNPTPRELKLYINQIGAIHRQWGHEFPMEHVAYFVLLQRHSYSPIQCLRNGECPSRQDEKLLGPTLKASLAGLAFNVRAAKGMEFLLSDLISEYLENGNIDSLCRLEQENGQGFWGVLEVVADKQWEAKESAVLLQIANTLALAGVLDRCTGPEGGHVRIALGASAKQVMGWYLLGDGSGLMTARLLEIVRDGDVTLSVFGNISSQLLSLTSENAKSDSAIVATVSECIPVISVAMKLLHMDYAPEIIEVPMRPAGWVKVCHALYDKDRRGEYWNRFVPVGGFSPVVDHLSDMAKRGEFSRDDFRALGVIGMSDKGLNWDRMCSSVQDRLMGPQGPDATEVSVLLDSLLRLARFGVKSSVEVQRLLVEGGYLTNIFSSPAIAGFPDAVGSIGLCFIGVRPKIDRTTSLGRSEEGYNMLCSVFLEPSQVIFDAFYSRICEFDQFAVLFKCAQSISEPPAVIIKSLKRLADADYAAEKYDLDFIVDDWSRIRCWLHDTEGNNRVLSLIGRLSEYSFLINKLLSMGFDVGLCELYTDVVNGGGANVLEFRDWLMKNISMMSKNDWNLPERNDFSCIGLVATLHNRWQSVILTENFSDSIHEHAKRIIGENDFSLDEDVVENWKIALSCISDSNLRSVLRARLAKTMVDADGEISAAFFEVYGNEVAEYSELENVENIVSHVFSSILRVECLQGLKWIVQVLECRKSFLKKAKSGSAVKEFKARVEKMSAADNGDEFQDLIKKIHDMVNGKIR